MNSGNGRNNGKIHKDSEENTNLYQENYVNKSKEINNKVSESNPLEKPTFTYKDYLTWDDERRYEIIGGDVYCMSPAPSYKHQRISGDLYSRFHNFLEGKDCEVIAAPFDIIFTDGVDFSEENFSEIKTVVQPDIIVACGREKFNERGYIGIPDLVIEIISPSSVGRDRKIKRELYEKQGVREYWIVDYLENNIEVYLLGSDNHFSKPAIYTMNDSISVEVLSGLSIEVNDIFK